jgi:ATP-dependent RNA helicase DeaD
VSEENTSTETDAVTFDSLGLSPPVLQALTAAGYVNPTPIQALAIPLLLEGNDIIGQAKTGTGKTAAFTLPLLGRIDVSVKRPQMLVIAPTRELALQVSESVKTYGKFIKGLRTLPVYGGQGMMTQLNALSRGVHIVVGTPGRLIDHLKRGTLKLDSINALVLDEADEMLRMGFIDDVETIMETMPEKRLTALFSATMPAPIARIAKRFLTEPKNVRTKSKEATVETVSQSYVTVSGYRKLEALARILEAESYDGVIVFTKTRIATTEVVERLAERGLDAVALNGDMNQQARQYTIDRFKDGRVDILVCTDVAARGLDVPRVSHVFNYDIPYDTEAYVHRIGRTGRAGRDGKAITFVARNDQRMFKNIERATRKPMAKLSLPTADQIAEKRIEEFKGGLLKTIETQKLKKYARIVDELCADGEVEQRTIAAALIYLAQRDRPFAVKDQYIEDEDRTQRTRRTRDRDSGERSHSNDRDRGRGGDERSGKREKRSKQQVRNEAIEYATSGDPKKRPMAVYRVEVGSEHGLEPRNLVGAISNETGIPSRAIGGIRIARDSSLVELPSGMPPELLQVMKKIWVCGVQLNIAHEADGPDRNARHHRNQASRSRSGSKQSPSRRARNERRANNQGKAPRIKKPNSAGPKTPKTE